MTHQTNDLAQCARGQHLCKQKDVRKMGDQIPIQWACLSTQFRFMNTSERKLNSQGRQAGKRASLELNAFLQDKIVEVSVKYLIEGLKLTKCVRPVHHRVQLWPRRTHCTGVDSSSFFLVVKEQTLYRRILKFIIYLAFVLRCVKSALRKFHEREDFSSTELSD
ncbi:hypothetical protein Mapa_016583 [Marchantia paleacea]|nr:hypothetical protein Mapa_016583 [Marchantia paleacea]